MRSSQDFWEVVNALGNLGPGASGSGLIDQNNHLVGSLTLGRVGDASGYGSCPASPPAAPNGSNGAADFTSGSGTRDVSESLGAAVSYKLTCSLSGGGSVSSSVKVSWSGAVPFVQLYIARSYVWTTRPATLQWTSNVSPCAIKGGG